MTGSPPLCVPVPAVRVRFSLCLRVPRRVLTRAALQNAGDNWTGPNNPFGPKIPLGAHGAFGSAPPTASGWSSGECNFNGQAQCGQVSAKQPACLLRVVREREQRVRTCADREPSNRVPRQRCL